MTTHEAMARRCPACEAPLPDGRFVCASCGLNVHYAEQVGLEAARRPPPGPARASAAANLAAVLGPFLAVAAVLAVVVGAIVVIPVGPDADGDAIEASVAEQLRLEGPPSSDGTATNVSCVHPLTNTRSFTCTGRTDVALLPDNDFTYKLQVYENENSGQVCWTGRGDNDDGPGDALLPARIGDCLD